MNLTATADPPIHGELSPPETFRVLVVDDQLANIQMVGNILGKQGYEIVPAQDGPTALKRIALRTPDLILMDVIMPDMNGFEVCRQVQKNPDWRDIPVIFVSAAGDKEIVVRAFDEGGVDYVTKPFNHAELLSRARTHLALKAARDRSSQLAKDKDELLGILAHDLKNHLSGMQLSAQLLQDRLVTTDNAKTALLVDNMCESTGRLLEFVKELLANAAMEHGYQPQRQRVNLAQAVSEARRGQVDAAARKRIQMSVTSPADVKEVYADRTALSQVLDNLLSNAVKFSPSDTHVRIAIENEDEFVRCTIQDEGPGFTPEDKQRMFQRYGRLSARPTGGEPSTGLGLSIVKKLMTDMGGTVVCESEPGNGATFTLRLPCTN